MGPTASGKTDLAMELAEDLDGELISVDSALVYRGLDIGSAKPDYPHHLIDICDPTEVYSAARFVADARRAIADIEARGRRPILVGGTMLYYRALFMGLAAMPGADAQVRAEIETLAARDGWPAVHRQLAAVDPVSASRIHPNHSQRLTRALEVFRVTGRPLSSFHGGGNEKSFDRDAMAIAIAPAERAVLHERIALRFAAMLEAGFVEEVRTLYARGDLHPQLPSIRAVGYRQLWDYVDGNCSLEEASQRAVAATRQLAKRQFTWLRKWPDLHWIHTDSQGQVTGSDLPETPENGPFTLKPANLVLNYLTYNPM